MMGGGGWERWSERGMEGGERRKKGIKRREGGKEREKEDREEESEGGKEGESEGGKEGGSEGGKEGGKECVRKHNCCYMTIYLPEQNIDCWYRCPRLPTHGTECRGLVWPGHSHHDQTYLTERMTTW